MGRGSSGPLQFVLGGTDYAELVQWRDLMLEKLSAIRGSLPSSDYKETKPQLMVAIDRTRAADLGVSVERSAIRWRPCSVRASYDLLDRGEEYDVIVRVRAKSGRGPTISTTSTCAPSGRVR